MFSAVYTLGLDIEGLNGSRKEITVFILSVATRGRYRRVSLQHPRTELVLKVGSLTKSADVPTTSERVSRQFGHIAV